MLNGVRLLGKLSTSSIVIMTPPLAPLLLSMGRRSLKTLVDFYGKEAEVEFDGTTYISPPLAEREEVLAEWRLRGIFCSKNS